MKTEDIDEKEKNDGGKVARPSFFLYNKRIAKAEVA